MLKLSNLKQGYSMIIQNVSYPSKLYGLEWLYSGKFYLIKGKKKKWRTTGKYKPAFKNQCADSLKN